MRSVSSSHAYEQTHSYSCEVLTHVSKHSLTTRTNAWGLRTGERHVRSRCFVIESMMDSSRPTPAACGPAGGVGGGGIDGGGISITDGSSYQSASHPRSQVLAYLASNLVVNYSQVLAYCSTTVVVLLQVLVVKYDCSGLTTSPGGQVRL